MNVSPSACRGVILGRRETYDLDEIATLRRHDLHLLAMDLQVDGARRWYHSFSRRYRRTRAQMIAAIAEVLDAGDE